MDQSLQAVSSLDISFADKLDIVMAVDEYVFGYCVQERNNLQPEHAVIGDDMVRYVNGLIATGDYPALAKLADEHGLEELWPQFEAHLRDPTRFDRNLSRLLDGIEADLPRRRPKRR